MASPYHPYQEPANPDLMDMDLIRNVATASPSPVNQVFSSSLSSLPGVTSSAPTSGEPTWEKRDNENPEPVSIQGSVNQATTEPLPVNRAPRRRPITLYYMALEYALLNPAHSKTAATAVSDFLSCLDQAVALPPTESRKPQDNLQAFLIQQQLVAGIPVDRIKPMRPRRKPLRRFIAPVWTTITPQGVYVPHIPPAQFTGDLKPLPFGGGLPNPSWVMRSQKNFRCQNAQDGNGVQPTHAAKDVSIYFVSEKEQELISQFYVEHFLNGAPLPEPPVEAKNTPTANGEDSQSASTDGDTEIE